MHLRRTLLRRYLKTLEITMTIEAVLIDSREPQWIQQLTFSGAPVTTLQLEFGDVHVATSDGTLLVIERKTPTDLLNTLRDDRLFPQVRGMLRLSRWAYVLITGEITRDSNGHAIADGRETGWDWKSVQGALLSIGELGAFTTFCAGDSDVEPAITRLANRERGNLLLKPVRKAELMSSSLALISSLPQIGPERAATLLDYCGTAAMVLSALTWNTDIPGISRDIKYRARHALGLNANEILTVDIPPQEKQ